MGKGGAAIAPVPDPVQTAQAQADANIKTAENQAQLNSQAAAEQFGYNTRALKQSQTNQVNPFGSLAYSQDPNDPDRFTATTSFSPELQAQLDRVYKSISEPINLESIGATQDTAAQALLGRLDPSLAQQRGLKESQLRNQGLTPGSTAWSNAFRDVSQTENDARLGALSQAGSEADRAFSRYMGARAAPLNEFSALVGNNNFINTPAATPANVATTRLGSTDYMTAVQQQQAAQQAQASAKNAASQANMTGLYGIGSGALAAGGTIAAAVII